MGMVMAVSFERYGRLYYLDPGPYRPRVGDKVLVPTDDGPEVAECVWAPQYVTEEIGGLPLCEGIAGADDLDRDERNRQRRAEARLTAKRLIRRHGLPMKVVGIDFVDRRPDVDQLVVVYFSAPHRVDFRELVRDLARGLRARIELRQVGARDEARLQGGIGPCGRDLCCATFLKDFEPVSVRMAKDQDLPLNPLKISGACGRLMCCLKYEHPLYQEFNAKAPKAGTQVDTPAGLGTVVGHNVPSDTVVVRLAASGRRCACSRASVCSPRQQYEASSTTTPDAPTSRPPGDSSVEEQQPHQPPEPPGTTRTTPSTGSPATTSPATGSPTTGSPATGSPTTGSRATGSPGIGSRATFSPGTEGGPASSPGTSSSVTGAPDAAVGEQVVGDEAAGRRRKPRRRRRLRSGGEQPQETSSDEGDGSR